jgi:5-formyltetrahydrofolate cyclo-ligase
MPPDVQHSMNEVGREKARLRQSARALRQRLTPAERWRAAEAVADHAGWLARIAPGRTVSCFSTFGDELDTGPLMARLARAGVTLALPVVARRGRPLVFRRWRPGDEMASGPFGIAQPLPDAPTVRPSVFLVPLLAFDRRGYRVGYGGGFYDRTLAEARAAGKILALGLAFAAQEIARVPTERYDEPVDGVLTETGVIRSEGGLRASALSW